MENKEVTIMEVLDFREKKAGIQNALYTAYPAGIVVSLGMNIPGPVKCGSSIFRAFCEGINELKKVVQSEDGTIIQEIILKEKAGYAAVYLVSGIKKEKLKKFAVAIEETHPLGRLFDIDVLKKTWSPSAARKLGR